ncbi:MAG: cation diffusion facilitator family transporter [Thiomonas sp.]|uniref:cation diffusion facilitator family transporter n=1 Tax=Thiomonas sp. TaxID=2047785 RepID=UPI002A35DA9D|nr:cation diffusion facilitator family transporter [Thiomonas sp.]MDY0329369.1 cation diffusion facilitator family transporter [Thiomonas sp.]
MQARTYLRASLLAALVVISLKLLAWKVTGSVGFLSDAMESIVNVAAAAFALFIVRIAEAPPDADHPYGHTKAEYFSSGAEGLLIGVAAALILIEAAQRLTHPQAISDVPLGAVISAAATAINLFVALWMLRGAKRLRSIVIEADARHLLTDVWTSAGVIAAVLLVPLTGWLWLDPVIGIVVALHILREAFSLVKRSVDGLMDKSMDAADLAGLQAVLDRFRSQDMRFDHVRTRVAGTRRFASMHLHMPGQWSLQRAADCRYAVEKALIEAYPGMTVTIEMLTSAQESLQEENAQMRSATTDCQTGAAPHPH